MKFRHLILVSVLLVAAFVLAGMPVFVHPQVDPLRRADAVVVLGGVPYERFKYGIELAESGYAPTVLISNSVGADDPRMQQICDGNYTVTVNCFLPDPYTTKGEAEEIRRQADANHWKHVIVVTYTPHISRARYIVEQCYSGEISMEASPYDQTALEWVGSYIYQTAGFIKAFLSQAC